MDFPGGETILPKQELKVLVDLDGREKALVTICFEDEKEEEWCAETIVEKGKTPQRLVLEHEDFD